MVGVSGPRPPADRDTIQTSSCLETEQPVATRDILCAELGVGFQANAELQPLIGHFIGAEAGGRGSFGSAEGRALLPPSGGCIDIVTAGFVRLQHSKPSPWGYAVQTTDIAIGWALQVFPIVSYSGHYTRMGKNNHSSIQPSRGLGYLFISVGFVPAGAEGVSKSLRVVALL